MRRDRAGTSRGVPKPATSTGTIAVTADGSEGRADRKTAVGVAGIVGRAMEARLGRAITDATEGSFLRVRPAASDGLTPRLRDRPEGDDRPRPDLAVRPSEPPILPDPTTEPIARIGPAAADWPCQVASAGVSGSADSIPTARRCSPTGPPLSLALQCRRAMIAALPMSRESSAYMSPTAKISGSTTTARPAQPISSGGKKRSGR